MDLPAAPTKVEAPKLQELKKLLEVDIASQPDWPDLTGDIRLLRFLRGYDCNPQAAADAYSKMLGWRAENGVDDIHQDIETNNLQLSFDNIPDGACRGPKWSSWIRRGAMIT